MPATTSSATASQRLTTESRASREERLVREHLPLVQYVVTETAGRLPRHVHRDDLVSAAMAALAHAARSFDEERGVKFSSYATTRIRGAILDELRGQDWASRSVRARARQRGQAAEELAAELGRTPTRQELADHLSMDVRELDAMDGDVQRSVVLSFQGLLEEGEAAEGLLPSAGPTPDQMLLERERRAYLVDAVAELPERLRAVVVGYFFDERPMAEIGEELGVTESRVSQMRAEALVLLRGALDTQLSPEAVVAEERPNGAAARRKAAYYASVAARSDFHTRLSVPTPRPAQPAAVMA
jgi:RNA polymerase sigma factor for flagellar operon FliA